MCGYGDDRSIGVVSSKGGQGRNKTHGQSLNENDDSDLIVTIGLLAKVSFCSVIANYSSVVNLLQGSLPFVMSGALRLDESKQDGATTLPTHRP